MSFADDYVLLTVQVINVILHSIGFHCLITLYKNEEKTIQLLYLCNLSLIEAIRNLVSTLIVVIPVVASASGCTKEVVDDMHVYFEIISNIVKILHINSMIFLTINRFLKVWLDNKYEAYCTIWKAKSLLIGECIIAAIILLTLCLNHELNASESESSFPYVILSLHVSYIIIVIVTYSVLYDKYRTSLTMKPQIVESRLSLSLFEIFQNSCFYITDLLITCYILITVIPDLTFMFIGFTSDQNTYTPTRVSMISAPISDLVHACIYILLQKVVRTLFLKSFYCRCYQYADTHPVMHLRGDKVHSKVSVYPSQDDMFEMRQL